jgi:hypothetical protein
MLLRSDAVRQLVIQERLDRKPVLLIFLTQAKVAQLIEGKVHNIPRIGGATVLFIPRPDASQLKGTHLAGHAQPVVVVEITSSV